MLNYESRSSAVCPICFPPGVHFICLFLPMSVLSVCLQLSVYMSISCCLSNYPVFLIYVKSMSHCVTMSIYCCYFSLIDCLLLSGSALSVCPIFLPYLSAPCYHFYLAFPAIFPLWPTCPLMSCLYPAVFPCCLFPAVFPICLMLPFLAVCSLVYSLPNAVFPCCLIPALFPIRLMLSFFAVCSLLSSLSVQCCLFSLSPDVFPI